MAPRSRALALIDAFIQAHPDWHLRLYDTPAGLRVLVMHRTFDALEPAVAEFFDALQVDPLFRTMCTNQHCFRARLGPKPWRVGIPRHMKPRPGLWPVNPERREERQRWIDAYEQAARGHAACRFVTDLGSSAIDAKALEVCELHDRDSQALTGFPIA